MPKPAIQVEGLDELRRALRIVKDKGLDDEMRAVHKDLAEHVLRLAQPKVPVRTGALKRSLRASGTVRDAIGRVGNRSVPYAAAVHWGHGTGNVSVVQHGTQSRHASRRHVDGRPFLREAAQEVERDVVDRYDAAVASMLNRIVKEVL